ncbi:MAG: hypothetical protein ACFE9D_12310 [Promethearchaeota archaeon]
MNINIAQMLSLSAFANAVLQDHSVDFSLDHSTARFCRSIEFGELTPEGALDDFRILAETPNQWFEVLQKKGVGRVRLFYGHSPQIEIADRIGAAFVGGGGEWIMETLYADSSDLWEAGWRMAKGGVWKVYYFITAGGGVPLTYRNKSVQNAIQHLQDILDKIGGFAREQRLVNWVKWFQSARESLVAEDPLADSDLLPRGCFSKEAQQLIAGCFQGWVFGGMGSWNDLVFRGKDQDRYVELSDQLYDAICQSLIIGVNSFP